MNERLPSPWRDQLGTIPQHLIPQHLLSRAIHRLTRLHGGWLGHAGIRAFIRTFDVDMSEAAESDPAAYPTFNAFFTRSLREQARPLCDEAGAVASPVDGAISQLGAIEGNSLFQAKGHSFDLTRLLGGDELVAAPFVDGRFATLYLAPRDYHRIHSPMDATLRRVIYVPGRLFAVKPGTVRTVPGLFARNERVVCLFDTAAGPMALVLVGAIFVGSIETVWQGEITPARPRETRQWQYHNADKTVGRGQEVGRFNMGSTVIVLFGPNGPRWEPDLGQGTKLRMGQKIAMAG